MPLKAPPTPLVIALTQGSADAFVQGSVLSGLSQRQAYRLAGIAFSLTTATQTALSAVNVWDIQCAITRRSKTAMPEITDTDVIHRFSLVNVMTTSGMAVFDGDAYWKPDFEIPLVEETLYAQLDSAGSGLSLVAAVRLDVDLDTISDIDRLNLITRSLT